MTSDPYQKARQNAQRDLMTPSNEIDQILYVLTCPVAEHDQDQLFTLMSRRERRLSQEIVDNLYAELSTRLACFTIDLDLIQSLVQSSADGILHKLKENGFITETELSKLEEPKEGKYDRWSLCRRLAIRYLSQTGKMKESNGTFYCLGDGIRKIKEKTETEKVEVEEPKVGEALPRKLTPAEAQAAYDKRYGFHDHHMFWR